MSRKIKVRENIIDRAIRFVAPVHAARRYKSRLAMAIAGSYDGASRDRRQTSSWKTSGGDPDADLLFDLSLLRERSRALARNEPIATGAINTVVTNVVGSGLTLQSRIDTDILNMTEEAADAWQTNAEREFRLWAQSQDCDSARTLNFYGLQELAWRQVLENGDVFVLPRMINRKKPSDLALQLIEADRVCNKDNQCDTPTLSGGIVKDEQTGAPQTYHILKAHPGNMLGQTMEWVEYPAFGSRTQLRNVLHLYRVLRPGQSRGVPYLAPVIETLKTLSKYTEAELMAAVVTSMLTVFIKTEGGDLDLNPMEPTGQTGGSAADKDFKLSSGAILGLAPGEDVVSPVPVRPNTAYDPFTLSILRQIGVALELPFELLVKHFTASYSAARAALLTAWQFFLGRRMWVADNFCQIVYEMWLYDQVASGRIAAPGFFSDPIMRMAYSGADWIGPAKGMINEKEEVTAAKLRVDTGFSTLDAETAAMNGGDWERNHKQQVKEMRARREGGLLPDPKAAPAAADTTAPQNQDLPEGT
jgi:lambda family phage portal protein